MNPSDVERRPTRAAALPVALAVLVGLLASSSGSAWLAAAAFAPVVLAVASVLTALPAVRHLGEARVALSGPSRVHVGDVADHRMELWLGRAPAAELTVEVVQDGFGPFALTVQAPGTPWVVEARLHRHALARGASDHAVATVGCTDVLHLFRWSRSVAVPLPVVVRPRRVRPATVPPGAAPSAGPGVPRPSRTGDLARVRAWQQGDATRSVHWRATARTGRPVVAVREETVATGCAVVLAGAAASPVDEERLALCAATSAAVRGQDPGATVAVLTGSGPPRLAPAGGPDLLLDWWARLPPADAVATAPSPSSVLALTAGAPTVLVVGSPALHEAWWDDLRAAARRVRTVVVRVP